MAVSPRASVLKEYEKGHSSGEADLKIVIGGRVLGWI
jgi:hypothetical protein